MTHLDTKALEAAREQPGTNHDGIIRAYLSALSSASVAEPVAWQWREGRSNRHQPDDWKWSKWQSGRMPQGANKQYLRYEERPLYLDPPPTSELEALRKRVVELEKALEPFADISDLIDSETEGMSETDELALHFHDYLMASWPVALFRTARRVREGGKVDG